MATSSPTKAISIGGGGNGTGGSSSQTSTRTPTSDFYRLAESGSSKALTAFGLAGKGGRENRKHRRGSRDSVLPHAHKAHLNSLFHEIEREFESLYVENLRLKEQIHVLEKACDRDKCEEDTEGFDMNVIKSFTKKNFPNTRHKLKAQTSKIVSSFKANNLLCSFVREFQGHRDGLWDVAVGGAGGRPLLGTASADRTARVWGVESGRCLLRYTGHQGSVNSIKFHPGQDLVITGSGDGTAHVWSLSSAAGQGGGFRHSSEEEGSDEEVEVDNGREGGEVPALMVLTGHTGVVVSADWVPGGNQAVTASWDRTAALWDLPTQTMIQALAGHDMELTGAACHPAHRLIVTSSKDSTFRLWDFRETIHSVSVFQGHTDSVTCAAFSRTEHIVSGSDDRTVKVWDLRNMRAPLTNIQTDSAVNKLAISEGGMVGVPQDNRHVSIYDIAGNKLSRLPRESGKCHMRMVSSVAWAGDGEGWRGRANLFSVGFDRLAMGWRVRGKEEA